MNLSTVMQSELDKLSETGFGNSRGTHIVQFFNAVKIVEKLILPEFDSLFLSELRP